MILGILRSSQNYSKKKEKFKTNSYANCCVSITYIYKSIKQKPMIFTIRNQANIPNKYLRFAKWKIRKLSKKYGKVLYSDIFINKLSTSQNLIGVTVRMGVPGPDIIISSKSTDLNALWSDLSSKMKRQLRKHNAKK